MALKIGCTQSLANLMRLVAKNFKYLQSNFFQLTNLGNELIGFVSLQHKN